MVEDVVKTIPPVTLAEWSVDSWISEGFSWHQQQTACQLTCPERSKWASTLFMMSGFVMYNYKNSRQATCICTGNCFISDSWSRHTQTATIPLDYENWWARQTKMHKIYGESKCVRTFCQTSRNNQGTENNNFKETATLSHKETEKAMSSLSQSTNILLVKEITGETLYSRNRTSV